MSAEMQERKDGVEREELATGRQMMGKCPEGILAALPDDGRPPPDGQTLVLVSSGTGRLIEG